MKEPIKRHEALKSFSREHHHGLLFCWKLREGFKKEIPIARIKEYSDWFKTEYLEPHFEAEEKYVFPVLGGENEKVKRALAEHRRLNRLFNEQDAVEKALHQIEEELDLHIRFEERDFFNDIQKSATKEQLADIEKHHDGMKFSDDDWKDHFWEKEN